MKKNVRLLHIECKTHNLYEWGSGWNQTKIDKWENYWNNIDSCMWQYVPSNASCCSGSLVCTGGAIYLHPMRFSATLTIIGRCMNGDGVETFCYYEDLCELMEGCAKEVGFTYELKKSTPVEVEFEMPDEY